MHAATRHPKNTFNTRLAEYQPLPEKLDKDSMAAYEGTKISLFKVAAKCKRMNLGDISVRAAQHELRHGCVFAPIDEKPKIAGKEQSATTIEGSTVALDTAGEADGQEPHNTQDAAQKPLRVDDNAVVSSKDLSGQLVSEGDETSSTNRQYKKFLLFNARGEKSQSQSEDGNKPSKYTNLQEKMKIHKRLHIRPTTKGRGAKIVSILPSDPAAMFKHKIMRAQAFLSLGYNVEFHIGARRKNNFKMRDGKWFARGVELGLFDWRDCKSLEDRGLSYEELVHLRPEVIEGCMPEGTSMALAPMANAIEYVFVIGPRFEEKSERGDFPAHVSNVMARIEDIREKKGRPRVTKAF